MTKEIPLTKGYVALVDDEDFEWLSQWKWYALTGPYASRGLGKDRILMHHAIMGRRPGFVTDHINRNRLDNRRSNLRFATQQQNSFNSKKRTNTSSQFRGVHWQKEMKVWIALLGIDGKQLRLGKFTNETDAARAYDAAARIHHGEFARLNFADEVQS